MRVLLLIAALVCAASAIPITPVGDEAAVAFIEIEGPGFKKQFDLSAKDPKDRIIMPNGPDNRPSHQQPKRESGEEIDPSIIWAIGKALWDFIEDNKPVADITTDWGGAVPDGVKDWTLLDQWKDGSWTSDEGKPWKFRFKNFLGIDMGAVEWMWSYKFGGQYNNSGQFLTLAMPIIKKVDVDVTEKVECTTKVWNPVNYGSTADPVGGVDLELDCKYSDPVKTSGVGCHIVIDGSGTNKIVSCEVD
uniref:Uncharacterized protein n=1 Tax=Palpitomonas bilix TaxID=652834 RepID=A0A7S3DDQ8_9EUKA